MKESSSPCLANKETCFFKPYSIESSLWLIHYLKNSSNLSQLLFLLCKIGSIKTIQFHQTMIQHLQSCTIIYSLSCSQILSKIVGDITQSNNGRIRLTQKTNKKYITWSHYIVFLRQYLLSSLLLLKGYRKFVPKIQPWCWVTQIAILENDHRISCVSCVSFQVNISLCLYL